MEETYSEVDPCQMREPEEGRESPEVRCPVVRAMPESGGESVLGVGGFSGDRRKADGAAASQVWDCLSASHKTARVLAETARVWTDVPAVASGPPH